MEDNVDVDDVVEAAHKSPIPRGGRHRRRSVLHMHCSDSSDTDSSSDEDEDVRSSDVVDVGVDDDIAHNGNDHQNDIKDPDGDVVVVNVAHHHDEDVEDLEDEPEGMVVEEGGEEVEEQAGEHQHHHSDTGIIAAGVGAAIGLAAPRIFKRVTLKPRRTLSLSPTPGKGAIIQCCVN